MTTISDKLTSIYNAKKDIKSAITEKGKTVGDNILDYAAAIRSIEQGSGGSPAYRNWWKVYFIDYDGTVLSYQEVNDGADFVFPDAPDHTDKELVFTGWNETSNHTSDYDPQDLYTIVIGATYDTVGNTKLMYNVNGTTLSVGVNLTPTVANGITIDWGDGTTTTTSSTDSTDYIHTYDISYLNKDVVVEIKCNDDTTYVLEYILSSSGYYKRCNCVKLGKGCTRLGYNAGGLAPIVYFGSSITRVSLMNGFTMYVTIPSSVKSIGEYAFSGTPSLQSLIIPSSVTSIDSDILNSAGGGNGIKSISMPSSVKTYKYNSFLGSYPKIYNKDICNRSHTNSIYNIIELDKKYNVGYFVKSINIPSGVTSIDDYAFYNCSSLQSVNIPSSVTSIGESAFKNCSSLQSVNIPSSVTSIGNNAFYYCHCLQSVTIPSSVTYIGTHAFDSCYGMQSVTIPSSVTYINTGAFENCYSLQSVNIASQNTGNGIFYYCPNLKSVNIQQGVKTIGNVAFYLCHNLDYVAIPSSVTSIGDSAFSETNCTLDFGNERTTVPTISSTDAIGYNFCIVPDALYDTWCAATNWSAITEKIIKYSDYHK